MKKSLAILTLLLGFVGTEKFCKMQTDGFSMAKIRSNLSYHPEWEVDSQGDFQEAFQQEFTYLGSGAQAFAFASEDGQYVLKFFNHNKGRTPLRFLSPLFPPTLKKRLTRTVEKRLAKRAKDFASYLLAFQELKKETGLLMLHLNKEKAPRKQVTLIDKLGIRHTINLGAMEFLLQRRATPLYTSLENWVEQGELENAKQALASTVALLHSRIEKGIGDKNPDLKTNFGVVGTSAMQFDIGRFRREAKDELEKKKELIRVTDRLFQWLREREPALADYLAKEVGR